MHPLLADDDELLAEYAVLSVAIEEGRLTEDAPEVRDLLDRMQASLRWVVGIEPRRVDVFGLSDSHDDMRL